MFPLLAVLLIVGVLVVRFAGNFSLAARADGPVPFTGTISPAVAHSHLQGPTATSQVIALSIGLRPRDADGLRRYVQDISRPKSVNYHRYLTPTQVADVFGPDKTTYNALLSFLRGSGFTITQTYKHRLLITLSGTVGQVEQVFHVTINNYSAPDGHVFYANATDPLLPASLVGAVQSISGLNNALYWHHTQLSARDLPMEGAINRAPTVGARFIAPSVSCPAHGNGYVTPDQTASAYNLAGLYNAGYHGEGQTLALFELDTYQASDLTNYTSCYGHAHPTIQTVVTGQGQVPTDSGVAEVELDAELVLSAAPQLGILRIYEAANDTADYNAEWARIVQDAPAVVSTSWGACELDVGQQEAQQENVFFTAAAAQGQSIFAASGDSGSEGCEFDSQPSNALNAGDPAAQPFVTGAGGTLLNVGFNGGYSSESVWNSSDQHGSGGASGGGISQFWSAPAWQSAPGVNNSFSTGSTCNAPQGMICREEPDVALNADPNNGYLVYCSSVAAGCNPSGAWYIFGGTSAAAPMWAAMMVIANEMSLKSGNFGLGFVNPLLYQVASNAPNYTASFHDVTSGNNDYQNQYGGQFYPASANYDLATGLGSYNAQALATNLVSLVQSQMGARSAPASMTWYFAEGSVGGSFQEFLTLQNPSAITAATVNVTYLFQSQSSVRITHTVPASTRVTINVNQDLGIAPSAPQQAISAIVQVTGGPAIVAERPMYFNFKGIQSGTDTLGATTPGTSYYFPEADSRQSGRNYYTYITMLNPSISQTATATVTFYNGSCGQSGQPACATQVVPVAPLHRGTIIPPWNQQMAIGVTSDQPMVVERPMYFRDTLPNAGGLTTGAASMVGATTPGNDWLFAEGYTGTNFQEYFVLANFGLAATTATITLEYSNGHTQAIAVTVPALGQTYFDVNQANAHPSGTCDVNPCQTTPDASAEITAAAAIVADRLMYFHYGPHHYSGGTETVGEAGPASHSVYAFAEGYTSGTFQEFLTLQNPTGSSETVAVTMFADMYVIEQQVVVKAHSRSTININSLIDPIAQAYDNMGANSYAVSLTVQVLGTGTKIVAERPMYFDFYGDQGGTDVIGFTG